MGSPPDANGAAVIASSEDGRSWWTTAPIRLEPEGTSYGIGEIVRSGDRLVALGERISPVREKAGARIWFSPPGRD